MKLSQEQLSKLKEKLFVSKACPNCGCTENRLVDPDVYELISYDIKEKCIFFEGNIGYQPLLVVRCPRCSYVSLFNLKCLGVLDA